jgi:hypothetical protein
MPETIETPTTVEDWIACLPLPMWAKVIPAGKNEPIGLAPVYISGNGESMSREQYISQYGVDPEIIWKAIVERQKRLGKRKETFTI